VCVIYNDKKKWRRGITSDTIQFGLEYFKEKGKVEHIKTNDISWFKSQYEAMQDKLL
jgi:hypothetical protein